MGSSNWGKRIGFYFTIDSHGFKNCGRMFDPEIKTPIMKRLFICITVIILAALTAQGQENKDVQRTTTVKKVTQKDTHVKTQVVKKTDTDKEILKVEGSTKQDQDAKVITKKSSQTKMVGDENVLDESNQAQIEALKQKQQAELQASIAHERAAAAKRAEEIRKEKEAEKQRELEERRAKLTHRPSGMAKYSAE